MWHWDKLYELSKKIKLPGIEVTPIPYPAGYLVTETDDEGDEVFRYSRCKESRLTSKDVFGCIGITHLDFKAKYVILTEGVSDFLAVSYFTHGSGIPIVGKTSSTRAIAHMLKSGKIITICVDNDPTGYKLYDTYKGVLKFSRLYLFTPYPYKDISDMLFSDGSSKLQEHLQKIKYIHESHREE